MAASAKTHVLTLVDSLSAAGGAERLAAELTREIDPSRFRRTLCVSRWDPTLADTESGAATLFALREAGVEVLGLKRSSPLAPRAWRHLRRYLETERVQVVHAHMFGSNFWGTLLGRVAGVSVVVAHEHGWAYDGPWTRRFVNRHVIGRFADAFVAVSSEDRRKMIEVERIPAAKARLIPNGMPEVRRFGGGDVRAELGISEGPVIGTLSTLRPEKALDVLVRAAALVRPQVPGLAVLIAGDGDPGPLRKLIRELGMAESVHLLGLRADVGGVLDALDVGVNCSEREGSPLSVMEYMEAGLPVVATSVGGIPDLVEDGVTGVLVAPHDPEGLAAAITGVLADTTRAAEMGRKGRERRRAEFDLGTMARRVEALYDELLAAKRGIGRLSAT